MNFIRLIFILILFSFSPVKGFTQSCPYSLVTNYPNGAKGCLTDLPLSKIVDKSWGRQIFSVAQYAKYYSIAASSICNYLAIGTSLLPVPTNAKPQADAVALGKCPSECSCAIVVDNGKVLLPQNLASLIGVNSETVASNLNSQDKANTQINAAQ